MDVEICINSESITAVRDSVSAAYEGGAARVELCSAMHLEGLTPEESHIKEARKQFRDREGLLVMIRPRGGDFSYSEKEFDEMLEEVKMAAECGADGVVFGVLEPRSREVDRHRLLELVDLSNKNKLATTFHRAFDATPDPSAALEVLIDCGVDRVLASGVPWEPGGSAEEGRKVLGKLAGQADGRIEIVIGGDVVRSNVNTILSEIPRNETTVSIHTYSGVHENGRPTSDAVKAFIEEVEFQRTSEQ